MQRQGDAMLCLVDFIMQVYSDMIQGSQEWVDIKLGVVSTSKFSQVLNKKTGRGLFMRKLAAERLTGVQQVSYTDKNMEDGLGLEGLAREYYEGLKNCSVEQVGFIKRDDWVGSSPDGLVGSDGQIEIKCPIPSTHIDNILRARMPTCYIPQVQGQLWVSERKWCDWISYCPAVKDRPFFSTRILRDEEYINKKLAVEVIMFVNELKAMIEKLTVSEF